MTIYSMSVNEADAKRAELAEIQDQVREAQVCKDGISKVHDMPLYRKVGRRLKSLQEQAEALRTALRDAPRSTTEEDACAQIAGSLQNDITNYRAQIESTRRRLAESGDELDYRMMTDLESTVKNRVKMREAEGLLDALKLERWQGIEGHVKLFTVRMRELDRASKRTFSTSSNLEYTARELAERNALIEWAGGSWGDGCSGLRRQSIHLARLVWVNKQDPDQVPTYRPTMPYDGVQWDADEDES